MLHKLKIYYLFNVIFVIVLCSMLKMLQIGKTLVNLTLMEVEILGWFWKNQARLEHTAGIGFTDKD
jgi:hypothetical protein